ncbi:MAG: PAS domain S-box protein [Desulfovibrionaceae bacterium]
MKLSTSNELGALRVAALYALAGGLWILFSDMGARALFPDASSLALAQTYKGWFFVLVTAVLLLLLVRRLLRSALGAQRALFETRDKFHSAFSRLPLPAHGYDQHGRNVFWNRACEEAYGYTAGEMRGQSRLKLILLPMEHTAAPAAPKESQRRRMSILTKAGAVVPVLSSHLVLTLPDNSRETLMLDIPLPPGHARDDEARPEPPAPE